MRDTLKFGLRHGYESANVAFFWERGMAGFFAGLMPPDVPFARTWKQVVSLCPQQRFLPRSSLCGEAVALITQLKV